MTDKNHWRPVVRRRTGGIGVFLFLMAVCLTVLLIKMFETSFVVSLALSILTVFILLILLVFVLQFIVACGSKRLWPAIATPPPPSSPSRTEDLSAYTRKPDPSYPFIAHARGQCGWVYLRLRGARSGRIQSFRIIDQAPARIFEAAAVNALTKARLVTNDNDEPVREVLTTIVFVASGPNSPEWPQLRLPETT